ncbi:MFS general substrate transporter [Cadophora sp. DSE1049]|nr:MFS general substrate transporter [Cadophora sp. DSE1049]
MAFYLYKKFIKNRIKNESPSTPKLSRPCEHQRIVSNLSDGFVELDDFNQSGRGAAREGLVPSEGAQKHESECQTIDGRDGVPHSDECVICKEKKKAMTRYRWKLMIGLCFPFMVQALDTTLIAGAAGFIASDFNQLSQLNWVISSYNITNATFIPIWGQFADVFGRYAAIQCSAISMLLGSTLCAAAPTSAFAMFLVGRALQGIGCAGLLIVTKVILADKVNLKENAANNTIFTVVAGIGYSIGPVIGAYLTQISWRWCFIINIPIGVIGLVLAHFVLRSELLGPREITRADGVPDPSLSQTFIARLSTIDLGGQFLFLFGMGLFVLALTWGGSYYPWEDVRIIVPLVLGVVLLVAFTAWEYLLLPGKKLSNRHTTKKAMIPVKFLVRRNVGLLIYINFVTGMAMYAVLYFVALYFSLIREYSAAKSGTNIVYYMPGLGGGAYLAMFAMNKWPCATAPPLLLGTILEPLGITVLASALNTGNLHLIFGMLALTGVGTGIRLMPGTLHGIGYFPSQISHVVSLMALANTLGGTLATTIMLNIFNSTLQNHGIDFSSSSSESIAAIQGLAPEQLALFKEVATRGMVLAFYAVTAFMWLGVVACCGMGNVWIVGEEHRTIEGSWVGYLLAKGSGKGGEKDADGAA